MIKLFLLCAISFCVLSCSIKTDKISDEGVVGVWKLYKIKGSMINVETEEEMMSFQEQYNFKIDGTFTKIRIDAEPINSYSGTGNYEITGQRTDAGEKIIRLTYNEGEGMRYSCSSEVLEQLIVSVPNFMENRDWAPCDGPFLYYRREAELKSL